MGNEEMSKNRVTKDFVEDCKVCVWCMVAKTVSNKNITLGGVI